MLFHLKSANKELGAFFAEFQRLALEGQMHESLPRILEQVISRELRSMLLHTEPPSREYHAFADFLQGLENRRRHYESAPAPPARSYAATAKAAPVNIPVNTAVIAHIPVRTSYPVTASTERRRSAANTPGPMDLDKQRRSPVPRTRRGQGTCFRCGSMIHLVRDYPQPDNRPPHARQCQGQSSGASTQPARPARPVLTTSPPTSLPNYFRSPSRTDSRRSGNDRSLGLAAARLRKPVRQRYV